MKMEKDMKKWCIDYRVGNTYKVKYVLAENASKAIRMSRIKNIVDLQIVEQEKEKED